MIAERVWWHRVTRVAVPLCLAIVELLHPTWSDGSVSSAVLAAGPRWLAIHMLLLLGYLALVAILWTTARAPYTRAALVAFALSNTVYIAIDGLGVPVLARADPTSADQLWNSTPISLLADLTGATWAASLLLLAMHLTQTAKRAGPVLVLGSLITWLAFLATPLPAVATAALLVSRIAAIATGAVTVYQRGSAAIPVALLIFAAVLRQHVGTEAALGLVLVAIATGRSSPVAASPP